MKQILVAVSLLLVLLTATAGFAQEDEGNEDPGDTTETPAILGNRPAIDVVSALLPENTWQGSIAVEGAEASLAALCAGDAQAVAVNRPISVAEETVCDSNGVVFDEFLLGYDGLAIITHPDLSFATCFSSGQLTTIFAPSAQGQIVDWAQTGLPTIESQSITVVLPPTNTATYARFDALVNGVGLRNDVTIGMDTQELINIVAATPGSVGVIPLSAALEVESVAVAQVSSQFDATCVDASLDQIAAGRYSAADELLLYVNVAQAEETGFAGSIPALVLPENAEALLDLSIVPPSDEGYVRNRAALVEEDEDGRQFSRDLVAYNIPPTVSGTVTIAGTPTAASYLSSITGSFSAQYQGVTFEATFLGDADAVRQLCGGEVDVVALRRGLTPTELEGCINNTISPLALDMGMQLAVVVRNASDDFANCLSPEQVTRIWAAATADAPTLWQDVDPSFPDIELTLIAPAPGTEPLVDLVLSPGSTFSLPMRDDVAETNANAQYRAEAVSLVPGALTIMSYRDYLDVQEEVGGIALVEIGEAEPCVQPAEAAAIPPTGIDLLTDDVSEQQTERSSYPYQSRLILITTQRGLSTSTVQSLLWYMLQDTSFPLYENSFTGLDQQSLPDLRDDLQRQFDTAVAAGLEPLPEDTNVDLNNLPPLGPGLPFDPFPSGLE